MQYLGRPSKSSFFLLILVNKVLFINYTNGLRSMYLVEKVLCLVQAWQVKPMKHMKRVVTLLQHCVSTQRKEMPTKRGGMMLFLLFLSNSKLA